MANIKWHQDLIYRQFSREPCHLQISQEEKHIGKEKSVSMAELFPDQRSYYQTKQEKDFYDGFGTNKVAAKRFYYQNGDKIAHYPLFTERKKLLGELIQQTCIRALWNLGMAYVQELKEHKPGGLKHPPASLLRVAVALTTAGGPKSPGGYALEPWLSGGTWKKWIGNDSSSIGPANDASVDSEERIFVEYLAFLQHCQFIVTEGAMFLSDFQGSVLPFNSQQTC
jgi:hypothetical protein